jgi:hypothetical protein
MIPINNSDMAWLIVSDYNQDNGKFYEELREDILNPDVNQYHFEHTIFIPRHVGGDNYHNHYVGSELGHLGGTSDIGNVSGIIAIAENDKYDGYVGGNYVY